MKCDICGSVENYVKEYEHNFERGNIKYNFIAKRRFCSKCNCLVYDEKLDNEASRKAIVTYTKIVGIEPTVIVSLRKRYNLTQEQFSKVIGCAKKTLISYEQGKSIPNDIYLVTLKTLVDNPSALKLLIDSNKDRYTKEEYDRINNRISKYLILNKQENGIQLTEYNGYTKLSYDKIRSVILYLAKDGILKTKLLKEMFYIDFISYRESGCSLTGLEYAKCPYGPVPDEFENIFNTLVKEDAISYEITYSDSGYEYHNIKSKDNFKKFNFTDKELSIIYKVKSYFQDFNVKEIVDFTHQEKAFLETEMFKLIDYQYAFDIERIYFDK